MTYHHCNFSLDFICYFIWLFSLITVGFSKRRPESQAQELTDKERQLLEKEQEVSWDQHICGKRMKLFNNLFVKCLYKL